ncbi:MAG: endolytic transglycosylase MltG [Nocardioides sp.]|nr:endolytic transglycosylase MltG [Nocardioides sp.]
MSDPVNEPVNEPVTEEASLDELYVEGGHRRKRRGASGCLPVLVALAVLAGLLYFGITRGVDFLQDQFKDAEDYPGPGTGQVTFEIVSGDSISDMGRNLKAAGVVASVEAFTAAAGANPDATAIQAGFYSLQEEMRASDVVEILVDPANVNKDVAKVTFPEGLTVEQMVDILVEKSDFKRKAVNRVLKDPEALGLPDYAEGNPEGYLFPATYMVAPSTTPESFLRGMVQRWEQAAQEAGLEDAADELGLTPHELMTVASLVEAEGRGGVTDKIARVIYNRLETTGYPTFGKLEIDATVNYALGRSLVAIPTLEDLKVDSPYNTYLNTGLPPGPIEAPGDAAIQAASDPADGDWLFYVTVNLDTGKTKFTESYDQFLEFKQELRTYCETQSERC